MTTTGHDSDVVFPSDLTELTPEVLMTGGGFADMIRGLAAGT